MKKAFTLSEALVTLAILGVLAAILIPVIDNVRPDKDKITYKKALYTMQGAVSNALDSTVYTMAANTQMYWKDDYFKPEATTYGGGANKFCESLANTMNTTGTVNCGFANSNGGNFDGCKDSSKSCYDHPNFITSDGTRFWGLEGYKWNEEGGQAREIFVDRNIGTSEIKAVARAREKSPEEAKGLAIRVWYDGKIDTGTGEKYDYVNDLIEHSFQVTENKY